VSARRLAQHPKARQDILSIVAYVAERNPAAARTMFDAYDRALVALRAHPEAGRRYVPDHPALGDMRVLPIPGFGDCLIFSRYDGRTAEVVRVLHGARDIVWSHCKSNIHQSYCVVSLSRSTQYRDFLYTFYLLIHFYS
jgi:plasmid stabilization system protein ParE